MVSHERRLKEASGTQRAGAEQSRDKGYFAERAATGTAADL